MGFIADLLGAKNNYQVSENTPAGFMNAQYSPALAQALQGIKTPQFDAGMANGTAANQNQLVAALQQQLMGTGPSVAQGQLQDTTNQNVANAAGQIASVRGMNPALAARLIANNTANLNQQAVGQGAQLRAQEQLGTQNVLAQALANQRSQDIGQATNAATIGLQGLDAQNSRIGTLGTLQNQQNSNLVSNKLGSAQINSGVAQQNANTNKGIAGGILGGAATALTGIPFNDGGFVPGTPSVPGNHPANDKVPAMLSPGEIIIPVTEATPDRAKDFVASLKNRAAGANPPSQTKKTGYGDVLSSSRGLADRLEILEMACGGMVTGMFKGGQVPQQPPPNPHGDFLTNLGAAYLKQRMARAGG